MTADKRVPFGECSSHMLRQFGGSRLKMPDWFCREKPDWLVMVLLVLLAAAVRVYSLRFCHVISTDGTGYVSAARAVSQGELSGIGFSGFYPLLVWMASRLVGDFELAGRLVSLVCGSLLVVPLYLLGRDLFSRRVALCAALVAVVWPPLVSSSCEVMTQASYNLLQLSGIYLVWRMFSRPTPVRGGLAGACLGVAYLTRPEGILLFVTLPLPLLLSYRDILSDRRVPVAYVAAFLVPFLFNMLLVHNLTGEWQLSAKTDSALNDALSYYLNLPDLNYAPGYEPKGYLEIIRDYPGFLPHNIARNLAETWRTILPPWFWVLSAVGFLSSGFSRRMVAKNGFILSALAPFAVLIVFYYVGGYADPYLPYLFLWGANGLLIIEGKLLGVVSRGNPGGGESTSGMFRPAVALAACYSLALFIPQVRADVPDSAYHYSMDNGRRDEKHIGLVLKENLPPGKIMTRWARIAFYAEREWVNIPAGVGLESALQAGAEAGARYFVADGFLHANRPALGREIFEPLVSQEVPYGEYVMTDPEKRINGLKPVFLFVDPNSAGVVVYEIPPLSGGG